MDPTPDGSVAVPIPIIKTAILRLHRQKKCFKPISVEVDEVVSYN